MTATLERLADAWGDALERRNDGGLDVARLRDELTRLLAPWPEVPVPAVEVVDLRGRDDGRTGEYRTGDHIIRIDDGQGEAQALDTLRHEAAHALHETLDGPIPHGDEHGARFEGFVRQLVAGRREQTRHPTTRTRSAAPAASGRVRARITGSLNRYDDTDPSARRLEFRQGQVLDADHPRIRDHLARCEETGEQPWFEAA